MSDAEHLKGFGITVDNVKYDREAVAAHAKQLASNVQKNLGNSLTALGVDIIPQSGIYAGANKVQKAGTNEFVTAKNIILAPGSVPFVPPGIQIDGKTVFTSDDSLKLEWVPNWVAIIGSGYIGLEFSDVYTALGSEVHIAAKLYQYIDRITRRLSAQISSPTPSIRTSSSTARDRSGFAPPPPPPTPPPIARRSASASYLLRGMRPSERARRVRLDRPCVVWNVCPGEP